MDTNKNSYTLIYTIVLVVIIAFLLSFVSNALRPMQVANEELDQKRQIVNALNTPEHPLNITGNTAARRERIEYLYNTLIVSGLIVNANGDILEESKEAAFEINVASELARPLNERRLPVFIAEINGQTKYILAVRGSGLWGPIWGYVALNDDMNTIFGAFFSHAAETPGLGSQIAEDDFQNEFIGKPIMNSRGEFVSVAVMKAGTRADGRAQVDALTGGTITSKSVATMLYDSLSQYDNFLKQRILTKGGTEE
jgi:Na+-transporting NADH:ubiquinone oxidoreductase subunit C